METTSRSIWHPMHGTQGGTKASGTDGIFSIWNVIMTRDKDTSERTGWDTDDNEMDTLGATHVVHV